MLLDSKGNKMVDQKKTHFGYKKISENEKAPKVEAVFNSVAEKYDLMNNLMSMGLHKVWKRMLIESTSLKKNAKILDIASGTADLAIALSKKNRSFEIYQTDINLSMIKEGQKKIINNGIVMPSIACDAEALPFPSNYFDCVTISFGLRNMTKKDCALKEIYRTLAPGGKLLILEFSEVYKPLRKLYDLYSFKLVPKLGKLFANDEESYKYLVESIRMHPNQEQLLNLMKEQGYKKTSFLNVTAGIVAIHKGFKF